MSQDPLTEIIYINDDTVVFLVDNNVIATYRYSLTTDSEYESSDEEDDYEINEIDSTLQYRQNTLRNMR